MTALKIPYQPQTVEWWQKIKTHTHTHTHTHFKLETYVTLSENPAKVIFFVICCFLQKNIILHKVKNILWKL